VIELGKKTILDGFGLALAGSVSVTGPIIRQYIKTIGLAPGKASVIGTKMKVPVRCVLLHLLRHCDPCRRLRRHRFCAACKCAGTPANLCAVRNRPALGEGL
jgi:hypothetical protein